MELSHGHKRGDMHSFEIHFLWLQLYMASMYIRISGSQLLVKYYLVKVIAMIHLQLQFLLGPGGSGNRLSWGESFLG